MTTETLTARPDTRDADATEVLLASIPADLQGQTFLVAEDRTGRVPFTLTARGAAPTPWMRRATTKEPATAGPPEGVFDGATLRLPRSREELDMAVHALLSRVRPGGQLWIYGANDEGIKSVAKRLRDVCDGVEVRDARKHCRVLLFTAPQNTEGLKTALDDWRTTLTLELPTGGIAWHTYPGVFAKGKLDAGTAALIGALPVLPPRTRVLDFAAGGGALSAGIKARSPEVELTLLEVDSVAVAAARINMPGVQARLGSSWSALPRRQQYDRIVSNPPIHQGKARDYTVLDSLISHAPVRLAQGGELWLVVQSQVAIAPRMEEGFAIVEMVYDDNRFRVWRGAHPWNHGPLLAT